MAQELAQQLESLKSALQDPALGPEQQEHLHELIADLERELALPPMADPAGFIERLRAWEARLAVDHPVAAGVLTNAIQKLESIGI